MSRKPMCKIPGYAIKIPGPQLPRKKWGIHQPSVLDLSLITHFKVDLLRVQVYLGVFQLMCDTSAAHKTLWAPARLAEAKRSVSKPQVCRLRGRACARFRGVWR